MFAFFLLEFCRSKVRCTTLALQPVAMVRLAAAACIACAVMASAFVAPVSRPVTTPRVVMSAKGSKSPDVPSGNVQPMMAVLLGLIFGMTLAPHSAMAGTGSSRPVFQLVRPSYMQGIDAANAAVKPGEIDYVTRSRIEAAQLPKAQQEMEMTRVKLDKAPTKEERVAASLKRLRQYSGIDG